MRVLCDGLTSLLRACRLSGIGLRLSLSVIGDGAEKAHTICTCIVIKNL